MIIIRIKKIGGIDPVASRGRKCTGTSSSTPELGLEGNKSSVKMSEGGSEP